MQVVAITIPQKFGIGEAPLGSYPIDLEKSHNEVINTKSNAHRMPLVVRDPPGDSEVHQRRGQHEQNGKRNWLAAGVRQET